MKHTKMAAIVLALLFLLTRGVPRASAEIIMLDQTLYCTAVSATSCSTQPYSGAYWTVEPDITINTGSSTFDFTLSVTANGGAGGYLQDFSGQYFFGYGASVSNLEWVKNPGTWADLQASKAGNNGTCNGSAGGVFCGSAEGTSPLSLVALSSSPVVFELSGTYTGTFLSNGEWNFQISAAKSSNGKQGGNAFAISQDIRGDPVTVPDGGLTVMLLGGALVVHETLRRRYMA